MNGFHLQHRDALRPFPQSFWLIAKIFPSVSLNQAVLAPPPVAMPVTAFKFGMSYSSNSTPLAFSSATTASTFSTAQNVELASDVTAPAEGYMKTHQPSPHS